MKTKELIEYLQGFDTESEVLVIYFCYGTKRSNKQ